LFNYFHFSDALELMAPTPELNEEEADEVLRCPGGARRPDAEGAGSR